MTDPVEQTTIRETDLRFDSVIIGNHTWMRITHIPTQLQVEGEASSRKLKQNLLCELAGKVAANA